MKGSGATPRRAERIVIVGTGTGVGKTHLSSALLAAASAVGRRCLGLKPIETGVSGGPGAMGDDEARLATASAIDVFHVKHPAPYRFAPPISPHLAARQAGVEIDTRVIRQYVEIAESVEGLRSLIIESAGGLFSPLGRGLTNLDLVRALEPCRMVLVAPDRLGVLHDLHATLGLARVQHRSPDLVVLSTTGPGDSSRGTNAGELGWLGIAEVAAIFPHGAAESGPARAAADQVWRRLDSSEPPLEGAG